MNPEDICCSEYRNLSRRQFINTSSRAALFLASAPSWLPKVAFATTPGIQRDVIISVYLRGGSDGLTMCVPYADPDYYAARPTLAIQPPGPDPGDAIDLDGFFGFPPAMAGLVEAFQNGDLAIVHATGSVDPSRSHFDAQRYMEVGKPADPEVNSGWLARHLLTVPPMSDSPLRGISLSYGMQATLSGAPKSIPIPNLDAFGLTGNNSTMQSRKSWLDEAYAWADVALSAAANDTQRAIDLLEQINFANYQPAGGAVYPSNSFGVGMKSVAALLKADVGVEAVHLDLGGWDTHAAQGVLSGAMASLMQTLSSTLGAFHADMFATSNTNFIVVVVSEFGRVVAQNGSEGTDHGHGNCMMLLGGGVNGGTVYRDWPGLAMEQRFQERDLAITIDHRDILAEVVAKRLANPNLPVVFPDYVPTFRGVVEG